MKENIEKILKVSETIREIKNILLKKKISNEELMYASIRSNDLIKLTEGLDARAYIFLGKIKHMSDHTKEAINAFNTASKINPILPSSYYGLFKIYMDSEKYDLALENILKYQKYSSIDCSLYINLLNKKLKNPTTCINKTDNIMGFKKLPEHLLQNYQYAIEAVNDENYSKALKHINICQKLIAINNIKLDLRYMSNLLIKLVEISNDKKRREDINVYTDIILSSENCGKKYMAVKKLYELMPNDFNVLLLLIEICIELYDIEQAKLYLNIANKSNIKLPKLKYLEQLINDMESETPKLMDNVFNYYQIDSKIDERNYEEAIKFSTECFENSSDPVYLYKSACIFFMLEQYDLAEEMFNKYLGMHSLYQKQSYYYLYYINIEKNELSKAKYYLNATYEIACFDGNNLSIEEWIKILNNYKENFDDKTIKHIEKELLKYKVVETNKVKIIEI